MAPQAANRTEIVDARAASTMSVTLGDIARAAIAIILLIALIQGWG